MSSTCDSSPRPGHCTAGHLAGKGSGRERACRCLSFPDPERQAARVEPWVGRGRSQERRRRKDEDPRDLWGRGAGAPRSLLSLLGPPCASAEAVAQRRSYAGRRRAVKSRRSVRPRRRRGPRLTVRIGRTPSSELVLERVDVVRREVRVLAGLERAPSCPPDARAGRCPSVYTRTASSRDEPLGRVVVALERRDPDQRVDRRDRRVRAGAELDARARAGRGTGSSRAARSQPRLCSYSPPGNPHAASKDGCTLIARPSIAARSITSEARPSRSARCGAAGRGSAGAPASRATGTRAPTSATTCSMAASPIACTPTWRPAR